MRIQIVAVAILAACVVSGARSHAQNIVEAAISPQAKLSAASKLRLTGDVDSNSPALWDLTDGLLRLYVVTSFNGRPRIRERP